MNLPEFDKLMAMAESSPESLEQLRRDMVERIIESAPNEAVQRRLRGLQFQIDVKVRQARTPMAACIIISQMMHDSLCELRGRLNREEHIHRALNEHQGSGAKVYRFDQERARRAVESH
jgi:hypothetical protein